MAQKYHSLKSLIRLMILICWVSMLPIIYFLLKIDKATSEFSSSVSDLSESVECWAEEMHNELDEISNKLDNIIKILDAPVDVGELYVSSHRFNSICADLKKYEKMRYWEDYTQDSCKTYYFEYSEMYLNPFNEPVSVNAFCTDGNNKPSLDGRIRQIYVSFSENRFLGKPVGFKILPRDSADIKR